MGTGTVNNQKKMRRYSLFGCMLLNVYGLLCVENNFCLFDTLEWKLSVWGMHLCNAFSVEGWQVLAPLTRGIILNHRAQQLSTEECVIRE